MGIIEESAKKRAEALKNLKPISYEEIIEMLRDDSKKYLITFYDEHDMNNKRYKCVHVHMNNTIVGEYLSPDQDDCAIYTNLNAKLDLNKNLPLMQLVSEWNGISLFCQLGKNLVRYPQELGLYFAEHADEYPDDINRSGIYCYYYNYGDNKDLCLPMSLSNEAVKDEIKNKAGILLISDDETVYNGLIEYGFKKEHIDWFKSIIVADEYFEKHPEELKKYHVILKGNQVINRCPHKVGDLLDVEKKISKLGIKTEAICTTLYKDETSDGKSVEYKSHILGGEMIPYSSREISRIFDKIVDKMYSNNTLRKVGYNGEFKPVEMPVADSLPLPTKLKDLKILYLLKRDDDEKLAKAQKIVNDMGLNVTVANNSSTELSERRDEFGDYDIIIASRYTSDKLIELGTESTEQCRRRGRKLALLVNYGGPLTGGEDERNIRLEYVYAGELAQENMSKTSIVENVDALGQDYIDAGMNVREILSVAINAYNEALPTSLIDLDLRKAEEYNEEYDAYCLAKAERKRQIQKLIDDFDEMVRTVTNYLSLKDGKYIERPKASMDSKCRNGLGIRTTKIEIPEDKIIEIIALEDVCQGETNFAVSFVEDTSVYDFRQFDIKINGLPYRSVGIYGDRHEELTDYPRISEDELRALKIFEEQVKKTLGPLVDEGFKRYGGSQKKKV